MIFDYKLPHRSELRAAIATATRADETEVENRVKPVLLHYQRNNADLVWFS